MDDDSADAKKPDDEPRLLSYLAHRQLIGWLGLALPVSVMAVGEWLSDSGAQSSLSGYYYTGAQGVFVGMMCAIGAFLLTYRGYQGTPIDRVAGRAAGVCAVAVGLLPTVPPADVLPPSWWSPLTGQLHTAAAAGLFALFIYFSGGLFRRWGKKRSDSKMERCACMDKRSDRKKVRDGLYLIFAIVMTTCVLAIVGYNYALGAGAISSALERCRPVLWLESTAVTSFAFSWLVKGEALSRLVKGEALSRLLKRRHRKSGE
jgi:hypothetical protein